MKRELIRRKRLQARSLYEDWRLQTGCTVGLWTQVGLISAGKDEKWKGIY